MSELAAFLKGREPKKHTKYAACAEWKDEKGNPVEWELKPLTSAELGKIRGRCMNIGASGKKMTFDTELYNRLITSMSVVYPNLKEAAVADALLPNAPLDQRTPENIICEILRDDSEFQALVAKVSEINGWASPEEGANGDSDLVETAKN